MRRAALCVISTSIALSFGLCALRFDPPPAHAVERSSYISDPLLGWVPVRGFRGIRRNGRPSPPGAPVLVTGDSWAYGPGLADAETWPARLEARLLRPVVNAGVPAYGLDQIVLRAESLLPVIRPELVIAAFIPHDVLRCDYVICQTPRFWRGYCGTRQNGTRAVALALRRLAAFPVPALLVAYGAAWDDVARADAAIAEARRLGIRVLDIRHHRLALDSTGHPRAEGAEQIAAALDVALKVAPYCPAP